ncbi:DNA-binding protein, partial [Salmonella enterica subsp. enterica serovar Enteritidis]|nr:DNA-binding protein [Salmonella enterica subsp. enterica serovar Enteritidis]
MNSGLITLTELRRMTGLTIYSTRHYLDKAERC